MTPDLPGDYKKAAGIDSAPRFCRKDGEVKPKHGSPRLHAPPDRFGTRGLGGRKPRQRVLNAPGQSARRMPTSNAVKARYMPAKWSRSFDPPCTIALQEARPAQEKHAEHLHGFIELPGLLGRGWSLLGTGGAIVHRSAGASELIDLIRDGATTVGGGYQ